MARERKWGSYLGTDGVLNKIHIAYIWRSILKDISDRKLTRLSKNDKQKGAKGVYDKSELGSAGGLGGRMGSREAGERGGTLAVAASRIFSSVFINSYSPLAL